MKDVVKNYVEKFNHIEFDEVKFDPDGKIKWKGNLIGQFIKGKELTKPKIKIFYDEYFELFKQNIEMKLIKFFEFMMEKKMSFFKKVEDIAKPSKFFRALEYSILENLGHCRKNSLDVYYNQLTKNEIEIYFFLDGFLHTKKIILNQEDISEIIIEKKSVNLNDVEIIANNSSRIKKEFSSKIDLRYTPKLKFELINNK